MSGAVRRDAAEERAEMPGARLRWGGGMETREGHRGRTMSREESNERMEEPRTRAPRGCARCSSGTTS